MAAREGVDVIVIGAGIIGLAAAAALAERGRSVVVVEREAGIARGVTSRSSEVVHAGLYYPSGSLKAETCIRGRALLYAYCERRGVPCRKTGKLLVACDEAEGEALEALALRAASNGVPLARVSAAEVARLEPAVACSAGLLSSETGIVDTHALALALSADAEAAGAFVLLGHAVVGLEADAGEWIVEAADSAGARERIRCELVVNAAGLASDRIASLAGIDVDRAGYRLHPCKGDYFALAPGAPLRLSRLVYPAPRAERAGLGIHATIDLAGAVRFGPDSSFVAADDPHALEVDPAKAEVFAASLRRFLPTLRDAWLSPAYAGVRPRLAGPGAGFRDFVIAEESDRGLPGLIDCVGIESPGLTAALAIAERVAELAGAPARS